MLFCYGSDLSTMSIQIGEIFSTISMIEYFKKKYSNVYLFKKLMISFLFLGIILCCLNLFLAVFLKEIKQKITVKKKLNKLRIYKKIIKNICNLVVFIIFLLCILYWNIIRKRFLLTNTDIENDNNLTKKIIKEFIEKNFSDKSDIHHYGKILNLLKQDNLFTSFFLESIEKEFELNPLSNRRILSKIIKNTRSDHKSQYLQYVFKSFLHQTRSLENFLKLIYRKKDIAKYFEYWIFFTHDVEKILPTFLENYHDLEEIKNITKLKKSSVYELIPSFSFEFKGEKIKQNNLLYRKNIRNKAILFEITYKRNTFYIYKKDNLIIFYDYNKIPRLIINEDLFILNEEEIFMKSGNKFIALNEDDSKIRFFITYPSMYITNNGIFFQNFHLEINQDNIKIIDDINHNMIILNNVH